ncbi:PAS domain-containing protein [Calothrix sp. 336/3]|uniref:PAS domain-containing protein n=1 Tax=Calothrix sp. 336/3 TaxID=1337936 RepID=UPI00062497F5|nr:PAS domain-containing protein [Calothrix sp. 336/3]AKG20413.1 hypothetical protein IJ00_02925 [Calothrix sp. 336/3]
MTSQRTVLVIASSEQDNTTYQQQLQQDRGMDYNILLGSSTSSLLSSQSLPKLDAILLELKSPYNSSFQFLRQLKEQISAPVIVIDGGDTEVAVQAFKHGAVDYLVKDRATSDDLRLAMRSAIENAELKRELKRSQETFRTSVENMLDCFGIFSALRDDLGRIMDFRVDYLNAAACENNQMPKTMQIGRGLCEILPAHRESGLFDAYCRVVETGEPLIKDSLIYDDTSGDRRLIQAFDIRATKLNDGFVASWRDVTDRKRLELEQKQTALVLQQSEERLEQTMKAASIGSWDWNIQTGEVKWSNSLEHLFGMAPGSFDGRYETVLAMIHPDDLPRVQQAIQQALQGEEYNIEFRFIKPDGSVRWASSQGQVFYDNNGNPVMMVGVDRDITAWKQTEVALRNSERRYRSLIEATAQIVWNTEGTQGEFISEQPGWSAFTGQTFDELKGWGWLNAIHPDDQAKTTQAWLTALENQSLYEVRHRLRRWDGVYRYMQVRAIPVIDENGTILEWLGIHSDVTEAQRAAAALTENEQLLRLALAGAKAGSWDWNLQTNDVTWSPENYDLYGVSTINTVNTDNWYHIWYNTIHPEDRERVRLEILQAIEQPQVEFQIEFRIVHSQHGLRWLLGRGRFTLNQQGQPIRLSGINLDITDRKQIEQTLSRSEEFKNRLLESSPDCIKVLDIDGRLLYMNAGGMCIMEIDDLNPYLNQEWVCFWGEEFRPLAEQALEVARTGEVSVFRGFCPTAKGTPKWWEVIVSPIRGASGHTEQVLSVSRDISDRRQTEQRLQESEERLRLGMQVAGFALAEIDYNTNTVTLSPEAAMLYGLSTEQLTISREQFHDTFHPEDRAHLEQQIQDVLDPGGAGWFTQDYRILWSNGEVKWLTVRKQVFFDRSNSVPRPSHAILVALDITDRKQAEQKLQENELRFRTLADNISQLAWMTDEKGWIFWYNQRWFDFTGTNLGEMQGWGWQKVHHPDHVERVIGKINQCFTTGEIWEDTFPLRGKNGEYRWFLSRAVPIRDERGKVLRWFGTNTDITDLQEVESALRQSEERYRRLADSIPQLAWMANSEGKLLDVNQRWIAFTGLSLEEAQTLGWETVVHPEDMAVLVQAWSEAAQQGAYYQAEGRMRHVDGTYRWFLHQAIPQENEQGQIVKWFGTATDIEIQKKLELDRDRLLQQEQAAREAAERANRIKDEFLAILSHELRSPLNPILGWTKLLQSRKLDAAKTVEALATIERNAKLQTQLIDDLLDVAKILRGKLVIDMTPLDLVAVIEAAIDTVRGAAMAKSIRLHTVLSQIGRISGDSARLQQVVWNLLSNAIKFTPNNGRVDILLERMGNQAQITVRDTGKGIRPNFLPHLFESFRQEDASTTRKYGGLGLGLAIARSLVEAHGGTITADSPGEGQGATFTVYFPLIDIKPQIDPSEQSPTPVLDLTGVRVLAVDDEADARELLAMVLTTYGAEVLTVTSATEVLTALVSFQPDLLVSDIGMPDVDGYSLIKKIRALSPEQGGQIPAIALTAYAREEDHQRALSSGFQQQVTKPLEPEQLVQVVVTLVRGLG